LLDGRQRWDRMGIGRFIESYYNFLNHCCIGHVFFMYFLVLPEGGPMQRSEPSASPDPTPKAAQPCRGASPTVTATPLPGVGKVGRCM
jgi:hypothetical protein